jgi:hypothetical protein
MQLTICDSKEVTSEIVPNTNNTIGCECGLSKKEGMRRKRLEKRMIRHTSKGLEG